VTLARARRRSKPSLLRRLRVLWVFIVVLLALAGYAGYLLATWSAFQPKYVAVNGNVHVSADEIRKAAALSMNRNVWLIDKHAAEERVDRLAWVQRAEIHRALPATVTIVVHERVPAACVTAGRYRYLVDGTAHVLESNCAGWDTVSIAWPQALSEQTPGAVLDPALVQKLLAENAILREKGVEAVALGIDRFGGLEARRRDGILIRFGDERGLAQKASLIEPILRSYRGEGSGISAIDVRVPATPVVELRRPKK